MSLKQPYFMMPLLIPDPRPPTNGRSLPVPVDHKLKELCPNGVNTYDAHINSTFCMHAALLWTIRDFPSYAMLSS